MSSSLLSSLSPSTIDTAVRPTRERKKTPKASALPRKAPTLTRKTKSSVTPLSLPPPFSLEMESDGVISPIDFLLAMCQQAIPAKAKAELQLINDEIEPLNNSALVALLTAKPQQSRGQKRKMAKVLTLLDSDSPSPVDTPLDAPEKSTTPTLSAILKQSPVITTPENIDSPSSSLSSPPVLTAMANGPSTFSEEKRKRKTPPVHHNSSCSNCGTRETTLWRRTEEGGIECNSCALYFRKNGVKRPISLQNRVIYKRMRKNSPDSVNKNEGINISKIVERIIPDVDSD